MDTVQIMLTCPGCGSSYWRPTGDGEFECAGCGVVNPPENMDGMAMKTDNTEWFGEVRWCEEDLMSALRDRGYSATEENVAKLYNLVSGHWFVDRMIEAGWDYIYGQIDSEFGPEDMEESK